MLRLSLFGSGQARFHDHLLDGFPYQQPSLLLCYLLLNRNRFHPRERLAAVFWAERPTQVARKRLRNALWRLRQLFLDVGADFGEYLAADEEQVGFTPCGRYWLDIEAFENSVVQYAGVTVGQLQPAEVHDLELAVGLYQGDLLEGIYDDWCLYERERLRHLYEGTLAKLMTYYGHVGQPEQGIAYGRRILALDNTRENVHRQLMLLLWQIGDRYAALGQYRLCCQILRDELGVPPTTETHGLYERIVHDDDVATPNRQHAHNSTGPFVEVQAVPPGAELLAELRRARLLIAAASSALTHLEEVISVTLPESFIR